MTTTIDSPDVQELIKNLSNPMWRICSGKLYKIITKGLDEDSEGLVVPFVPNRAQRRFIKRLWHRNVILKARQLGFTTLIAIVWLDHALFNPNSRCGIIAQDKDAAQAIFRDKVKFAYENLPPALLEMFPIKTNNTTEIVFAHNNSSVKVATSMRSGTIHRLHISEFGKICAKYPEKAVEVITGSIPAVPMNGVLVIESTAEGRDGEFYKITERAKKAMEAGKKLTERDYRFHFFPWFEEEHYEMEPDQVAISEEEHRYFDELESKIGKPISARKRAWYVATKEADFSGEDEKMWQEYPSTPEEAFQKSKEGCYYTQQMIAVRKQKRITKIPLLPSVPCYSFWDIGNSDGTAIWVAQKVGMEWRFVKFIEGWGEAYSHFTSELQKLGVTWAAMYLPHDADHARQGQTSNKSPKEMLEELMPGVRFEIVPRIGDVNWGIQQTRDAFPMAYFDEEGCKEGIDHLDNYSKKWNAQQAVWSDEPLHDIHSEASDALRQWAQAIAGNLINAPGMQTRPNRRGSSWRTT